jgi:integrase
MPNIRQKHNKRLPSRWRFRKGRYRYRVPSGQEHLWDHKTEFVLGRTLSEAHIVYAGRIASVDGAIQSFNQLIDRYLLEVTPTKSQATQIDEVRHLTKLREMVGDNPVSAFKPHHAYQLRDTIHKSTLRGSGETYTNRVMEKLKHLLTKAIEWGVIPEHPMTDSKFKMLPTPKKSQISRALSIEQVEDMLPKAVPWLQCYVKLKLMTGLRQVDLLLLTVRNITPEGLLVTPHKTENSSGKTTLYEWTPELRKVISQLKAIPPSSIHLFKTQQGRLYFVNGRYTTAFSSSWARWMKWFPKELRFSERSVRNLVGSEDGLVEASKRLGHADTSTTAKYYRLKPTVVTPLGSHKSLTNS